MLRDLKNEERLFLLKEKEQSYLTTQGLQSKAY